MSLSSWDSVLLEVDESGADLRDGGDPEQIIESWTFAEGPTFGSLAHPEYDAMLADILRRLDIDLLHVRHMVKQPLSAPRIATELGVPVVVSVHDHYYVCPTIHLIDDKGRFCGGTCSTGAGSCPIAMPWIRRDCPPLKHDFVYEWRERTASVLALARATVTTSPAVSVLLKESLPELRDIPNFVIEHGRDLDVLSAERRLPESGPYRAVVIGNLNVEKGANALLRLAWRAGPLLTIHVIGDNHSRVLSPANVRVHGRVGTEEVAPLLEEIDPHLGLVLSPWGETWSHALTELWAFGLPVIAADRMALKERIESVGGGLLVDPDDDEAIWRAFLALTQDDALYNRLSQSAVSTRSPSTAAMAREYEALYTRAVDGR